MQPDDNAKDRTEPGTAPDNSIPPDGQQVLKDLSGLLSEWLDHAGYYAEARADEMRVSVKRGWIYLARELSVRIAVGLLMASGVIFVFIGLAGAFSEVFDSEWVGWVISGALLCALTAGGMGLYVRERKRRSLERTQRRYERLQQRQRERYGHSVKERAGEAPVPKQDEDRATVH